MSSILKALKKLEREKSRQRDDHVDLARDIFRGSERRRGPDWITVIVTGVVVLSVVAVILLVLRQMEGSTNVGQGEAPAVVNRPAAPSPGSAPNASVAEELIDQRRPQVRPPPAIRKPSANKGARPATAVIPPGRGEAIVVEEVLPPPAAVPVPPPAVVPPRVPTFSPAPPGLVLSAIVFQAEHEARIAVVNDLPVMEGSQVGEFRVDEIQADRVILSRNGTLYEVRTPD